MLRETVLHELTKGITSEITEDTTWLEIPVHNKKGELIAEIHASFIQEEDFFVTLKLDEVTVFSSRTEEPLLNLSCAIEQRVESYLNKFNSEQHDEWYSEADSRSKREYFNQYVRFEE